MFAMDAVPKTFAIGVVCGPTASGKTTRLNHGSESSPETYMVLMRGPEEGLGIRVASLESLYRRTMMSSTALNPKALMPLI